MPAFSLAFVEAGSPGLAKISTTQVFHEPQLHSLSAVPGQRNIRVAFSQPYPSSSTIAVDPCTETDAGGQRGRRADLHNPPPRRPPLSQSVRDKRNIREKLRWPLNWLRHFCEEIRQIGVGEMYDNLDYLAVKYFAPSY